MERNLNKLEKRWIALMLNQSFEGRDIIKEQLEHGIVVSETFSPFISLRFRTTSKEKYPYSLRVPAEMIAYQDNGVPVEFLLHVVDGFIDELEIFSADGSIIKPEEISLDNIGRIEQL